MIYSTSSLVPGENLEADICVVGAGAAGITLALELYDSGKKVIILESGYPEQDERVSSLYEGHCGDLLKALGHGSFLTESRTRREGGSTNCWGGTCRPLDPLDFGKRAGIAYSGWPITRADLDPYYHRAHSICGLDEFIYDDPGFWVAEIGDPSLKLVPHTFRMKTVIFQEMSPKRTPDRRRFYVAFSEVIRDSSNISLYNNANVIGLETNGSGERVLYAHGLTIDGMPFLVKAKLFILAAGGIETVRIMLLSDHNQATNGGIGNQEDLLGRFFMVHPLIQRVADVGLQKEWPFYTEPHILDKTGTIITARLAPSEDLLRESSLGNFRVFLPYYHDGGRVIVNLNWEQIPNPDSRITLSEVVDSLQQRRVQLSWALTDKDKETARWAMRTLSEEFSDLGLGQIDQISDLHGGASDWQPYSGPYSPGLDPGDHHMGTTRMSKSPMDGVVDENCKVHQTTNLYVASSSVFPTGGYANPTLTIMALSIRLADRIKAMQMA